MTARSVRPALVLALVAAAYLAGLATPVVDAATVTVRITDGLDPVEVQVVPGTTVTWVNESGNRHRMRSVSGPAEFDSGDIDPGGSFSFTFSALGTTAYRDEREKDDPAFQGTIVVAEAATPTPPSSSAPGATPTPPPASATVGMAGRVFRPSSVTIAPGGSVTWRNDDDRDHTVTATGGGWDSGTMASGATYRRTFPTAGTFRYFCVFHPDMTGTVMVAAPGTTPPPAPRPTPAPSPTPPPPPPPGGVTMLDFRYAPTSLTVPAGTRVTFVNAGGAPHTATALDDTFDSGVVAAGASWSRTFTTPGTFPYLCSIHPEMTATLVVTGADGAAPPPASPRPSPPGSGSGQVPTGPGSVTMLDFSYRPGSLTVRSGSTVTFINTGRAPHTVTDRAGRFDSGLVAAGDRWSRRFDVPGTYRYICTLHPQMNGVVVVQDATGAAPAAPPDTTDPPASPAAGASGGEPGASSATDPDEASTGGGGNGTEDDPGDAMGQEGDTPGGAPDPTAGGLDFTATALPAVLFALGLIVAAVGLFGLAIRGSLMPR